jgi:hypothetical protein
MSEMVGRMQDNLKKTSGDLFLFCLKFLSGGVLGLTFALVMQEALGKAEDENLLGFFFVIIVTTGAFLRISKAWGLTATLIVNLVLILIGMILRMYIMVAPGL